MSFTFDRTTRLRLRRLFRRRQRQMESAAQEAEAQFENNLIARFDRLLQVKRFAFGWTLLVILLIFCTVAQTMALSSFYQTTQPVAGGVYNEGIIGSYSNANPIYATGAVDSAVSRLLFAGLLKYDNHNTLTGDLASSFNVDASGRQYTVTLKSGLKWHDGKPLTAKDVVFTYHTIQNPDATSPLLSAWQGIQISATNATTVRFDLPGTLSSFPHSLTTGIIPEHILGKVPADQLRSSNFNTLHPVGAGAYEWRMIETSNTANPDKATTFIALKPFKGYVGGEPALSSFIVRAYPTKERLIAAFRDREVNAMAGLNEVPEELKDDTSVTVHNFPSSAALMTFFKTSEGVLSEVAVRQALVKGADTKAILQGLSYQARPVNEALLIGQLGYDSKYQQAGYDPAAAAAQLQAAGWVAGKDGIRSKNGQELAFRLYAQDTPENKYVTDKLVANWRSIGVQVAPFLQQNTDFQTTLKLHNYGALLHGISIGSDPDVYAYWDSAQADVRSATRLNFSEYKSSAADAALESGRTRTDPALRVIKYRPFLQAWQTDAPALGLYQPRFLYITRGPVYDLEQHTLNSETDRYNSVAEWKIHTAKVTN
ncbi:hypothetical protein EYC59_06025 [Candidatus Saccharibacteria bacterium]|nr:MAG: hypothetical protein EYC59_06025 [Candidatus Saccharibacteria bacterium]